MPSSAPVRVFAPVDTARTPVDFRDTEVEYFGDRLLVFAFDEEDIVRLEIAMNDPCLVRLRHGATDLLQQERDRVRSHRTFARQPIGETLADQQLHHDEGHALGHAVVERLHDVRAAKSRCGLSLPQESFETVFRGCDTRVEQLHPPTAGAFSIK